MTPCAKVCKCITHRSSHHLLPALYIQLRLKSINTHHRPNRSLTPSSVSTTKIMDSTKAHFLLLLLSCLLLPTLLPTSTSANTKPHALLFPVKKDPATLQYVTRLKMRSPSSLLSYVVDLGQRFLWLNCESKLPPSSTLHQVLCTEPDCKLIQTPFGCADNTSSCSVLLDNPFSLGSTGELTTDRAAFVTTDGSNPGPEVVDKDFLFACASSNVMPGLAAGAVGIAGFGRNRVGMPIQLAVEYGLQPKFALCLTGGRFDGVIFIGDGPYKLLPAIDATPVLYTPLIVNRVSTAGAYFKGEKSVEYFIGIKSIKVNNKAIAVNASLLSIDRQGNGGTKISTTTPYTTLETSIYKAVTGAFATSLRQIKRVAAVGKFRVCYNATDLSSTRVGPGVPQIDLVMQNNVTWTMFGANTMVEAKTGILCLAFVDGGLGPRTSVVIGGHQLEDNLIQFDLKNGRLGFTSSLLFRQTTCSNFNFTIKA